MSYYGNGNQKIRPVSSDYEKVSSPDRLYQLLTDLWCEGTCAPRLREQWCKDNPTLGQCSITAFLAQDIFGGHVYGVLRPGGNYHCYNEIDGYIFDLTSEQFGIETLDYQNNPEQYREVHFAKEEKKQRYEYLRDVLQQRLEQI